MVQTLKDTYIHLLDLKSYWNIISIDSSNGMNCYLFWVLKRDIVIIETHQFSAHTGMFVKAWCFYVGVSITIEWFLFNRTKLSVRRESVTFRSLCMMFLCCMFPFFPSNFLTLVAKEKTFQLGKKLYWHCIMLNF